MVGPVSTMPGNPPIASGPAYATEGQAGGAAANPVPTLSHSPGSTLASSDKYVPGAVFAAVTTSSSAYEAPPAVVTSAPSSSSVNTQSYFSTGYSTSGHVLNEILWVEELVTVTATTTPTVIPPARRRHLHSHQHRGF